MPEHRERLKDAILFSGIIDLQDTIINRGGYQNIGHKALRARALVDIADYLGLTIETVSRTLTQLENSAAISLPSSRRIEIRNRAALNRLDS